MSEDEKVREHRLRRAVRRQGYALEKSKRRNSQAPDFGLWRIVDPYTNTVIVGAHPWNHSMTLDDIEEWLRGQAGGS